MPLTERDERDLAFIRDSPEAQSKLPGGYSGGTSDAALAHAIFVKGVDALMEEQYVAAYQEMASDEKRETHARRERVERRPRVFADPS